MELADFSERECSIPADFSRLGEVRRFADEVSADYGFDGEVRAQIKLAVNEAVANAIEHGSDTHKDRVMLRATTENDSLAVYITDIGTFKPPLGGTDELQERGRGLAFMHLLMDEVEVRPGPGGTVIRLVKRLPHHGRRT